MFVLLVVEPLQRGRIFCFAVFSHLVSELGLLPGLGKQGEMSQNGNLDVGHVLDLSLQPPGGLLKSEHLLEVMLDGLDYGLLRSMQSYHVGH